MIPSNFIHGGPLRPFKQVNYTDGTPSREVEQEVKPDIEYLRKRLKRISQLINDIEQELEGL